MSAKICSLEEFCRLTGDDPLEAAKFFLDNERARLMADRAALDARSNAGNSEALPLMDADGYEFARLAARIPVNSLYHFMKRKDFGLAGVESQEGIREIVRDNPAWGVKTVSGKATAGWEPTEKQKAESRKQKLARRSACFGGANFNGLKLAN